MDIHPDGTARFPQPRPPMNLTEELGKLAELRQAGHLTEPEFAEAKRRIIAGEHAGRTTPPQPEGAPSGAVPGIAEKTYQSSRWSAGNFFFPDRLTLASDGMSFRKGALFGSSEEHINYRAVASFRITNGIFLSCLNIETSGGSQPIFVNGLWKSEAKEIQDTLRLFQKTGQAPDPKAP